MALQGSLQQLRLGDVVQTIVGNAQTGALRIRQGGHRVILEVGPAAIRLVEPLAISEDTLLDAFCLRGLLSADAVAAARKDLGSGDTALGRLRTQHALPEDELRRVVEEATEDAVLELLAWDEGDFRFDEGASTPPATPVNEVILDPAGILLRSAQRLDERQMIDACLGRNAMLLMPTGGAPPPFLERDDDPTSVVFAHLDGRTLLDEAGARGGFGLFAARKAACALVEAGSARAPTAAELAVAADAREKAGEIHAALALYRQWQAMDALDPAPLTALAGLASRAARHEDEAEALKALGRVHLQRNDAEQARDVYARLLAKRPGDRDALDGLREATRTLGDNDAYAATTRQLAELAMENGETAQASVLLHELLTIAPDDRLARLLRAKALVRLADRVQAIDEIERIADILPPVCRLRADADVARQCRETLMQVAPERSDLLRRLRNMVEGRKHPKRRVAIVGALVCVLAGAGYVLWPASPKALLTKAQAAAEGGDSNAAMALISELSERFPDSPETAVAMEIKNRIVAEAARRIRPEPSREVLARVAEQAEKAKGAFPAWPDPLAVEPARQLVTLLDSPDADLLKRPLTPVFKDAFVEAATKTRIQALVRRDALDAAREASVRPPQSLPKLRDLATGARRALDLDWARKAGDAARTARRLANLLAEPAVSEPLRGIEGDVDALLRAMDAGTPATVAVERELLKAEIQEGYEKALGDGARLLAGGRLDDAEAVYRRLAALLATAQADPGCEALVEECQQRGVVDFAEQRTRLMRNVRAGLEAATAAEKANNLAGAAAIYAKLVSDHPYIRFDEVFSIPLRVESLPSGSAVAVNGKAVGTAPVVVRYGWGSRTVVTVASPGFDDASVVVPTSDPKPSGSLRVSLVPLARWTKPLVGVVEAPPISVGGDVLVCNRAGRVDLRARDTGEVRWVQELKTLEGVRARPSAITGTIWVALVDGRVARLAGPTGAVLGMIELPSRPVGDTASSGDTVAVALDHAVVLLAGASVQRTVAVEATVIAGVVAAHDAFWVGTASGGVVRVDPRSGASEVASLGTNKSVTGLARAKGGVLALTGDGGLYLVDASGRRVLWHHAGLAEAAGAPVEAGDLVAAADRVGHVRLFSRADGSPAGELDVGSPAPRGLLEVAGRIAAILEDGRLWVYDPATKTVLIDAVVSSSGKPPPSHLGDGVLGIPVGQNSLRIVGLPK